MDSKEENIHILRHNLTDMMNQLNRFSGFVLLLLAVLGVPGSGMELKKCRGVDIDIDMAEDHVMHMNECLKEAGAKELQDIPTDKIACFGKCVFAKKGLIDDKGKPHKEKILTLITDKLPKEVHEDLNKKVLECISPSNTEIIDPEDESCTTYLPMLMCIHVAFLEECVQE